jgi:glycosyltransferase involved in cell wall biosynthesis
MHRKKIVWVAHEGNKSGANLCLKEFMQIATEAGFEQLLILPHTGSMESVAKECNVSIKVIHYYSWTRKLENRFFDSKFLKRFLRNLIAVIQLSVVILRYKADIVFTNTSVINIGAWASLLTRKKHYWYVHEMGEEDFGFKLPWGKLSYWFMQTTSVRILTNSFQLATKYKKKKNDFPIEVVRYAVLIDEYFVPISWEKNKPVRLLLLGQVAETKGHLLALRAIAQLNKDGYNVSLSIVGRCESVSFQQKLNVTINDLEISELVQFVDYSPHPTQVIAAHHILLMCSICEAFGRVTVEAMKTGVPVIGSNTCGTKEIIEHGETGYLFEQGNAEALSTAIKNVIGDEELRTRITRQAKESSEQLTNKAHFLSLLKK